MQLHRQCAGPATRALKPATPVASVRISNRPSVRARAGPEQLASSIVEALPAGTEAALINGVGFETGLVAGGVVLAGIAGGIAWAMQADRPQRPNTPQGSRQAEAEAAPLPPPRENAVLVLGATGRLGRRVVKQLVQAGRTVVAAARSADALKQSLEENGITEGRQPDGRQGIVFRETFDMTKPDSLSRPGLWEGVTQVIILVGARSGPLPGGGFGYTDGTGPDIVEAQGVSSLMAALPKVLAQQSSPQYHSVVPMGNKEELGVWERMDDVIMGGNSSSTFEAAPEHGPAVVRWKGDLIVEGGGFCGARTKVVEGGDLSAYDGIAMRVKGDGQIFKLNIKTVEQLDSPESTYQTTFDTVAGQWHDIMLPWHNFVPVKRAQSDPDGKPLDPSKIAKFGLVLSRFEFNKMPNPIYRPGSFELLVDGGIKAYKAVRPQLVHLTSAGVERNAIVGDDNERRKKDIPIVQLNPGGVLNHKYAAEIAVRSSGYPYTVVRSTGLIDSQEGAPFLFEADQGDVITGTMGRDDMAEVLAAVLEAPEAAYKTFEVRRNEALDGRGRAMQQSDYTRMFLKLALDRNRWRVGLGPFPKWVPPPPPVTPERKEEILADVQRVRDVQKAAAEGKKPASSSNGNGNGNGAAAPAEKETVSAGASKK